MSAWQAGIVPDSTPPGTPEPSDEDCEDARGAPDASRQFAATEHSGGAREQERRGTAPRGGDESNDDNMAGGFVVIEDDDDAGGGGFLPPEAEGVGKGQDNESAALAGRPHESVLRPRAVGMGVGHAPAAVPMVAQPPTMRCAEWRMVPVGGFLPADCHDGSASARGDGDARERHGGKSGSAAGGAGENAETFRCRECGEANFQSQYHETFGVLVCKMCCAADEKYKLITKTTAKEELLVTDEDLKPLGFISRKNPRKDAWGEMKLFLRFQIEEIAFQRYGDLVGVEAQKLKRQAEKYERLKRKKPTGSVLKADEDEEERSPSLACRSDGSRGLAPSQAFIDDRPRKKKNPKVKSAPPPPRPMAAPRHVHVWGEEWYDEAKQTWRHKCVECACTASFERL
eukprot:Tamp_15497.p1 GENE.Tamp_15497~~Tamp_15497.p1  ORF type:complete len:418 (-),score=75.21 Tamp_15497:284-1483(-)